MNVAGRLLEVLRRRSRRRGFGVHSPFAYRYITEVVAQRYSYYAYDDIAINWCKNGSGDRRMPESEARLLFRIACHQQADVALYLNPTTEQHFIPLMLAKPSTQIDGSDGATLAVADGIYGADDIAALKRVVESGGVVVLRNMADVESGTAKAYEIVKQTGFGMSFTDGRTAVYVGKSYLPRQDFELVLC